MNDRYLFRAKSSDAGKWVIGSYHHQTDYYGNQFDEHYIIDGIHTDVNGCGVHHIIDPSTICQCTGLRDKNGTLIWENDIINKVDTNALGWNRERFCAVSWDSNGYWKLMTIFGDGYFIGEFESNQLEVIGSKIDNPELLEVELCT